MNCYVKLLCVLFREKYVLQDSVLYDWIFHKKWSNMEVWPIYVCICKGQRNIPLINLVFTKLWSSRDSRVCRHALQVELGQHGFLIHEPLFKSCENIFITKLLNWCRKPHGFTLHLCPEKWWKIPVKKVRDS